MKAKLAKLSSQEYNKAEKAIRSNIEVEMRSRAVSTGVKPSKGTSKKAAGASKGTSVKNVLRNLLK